VTFLNQEPNNVTVTVVGRPSVTFLGRHPARGPPVIGTRRCPPAPPGKDAGSVACASTRATEDTAGR
jgi:hypothetical protein